MTANPSPEVRRATVARYDRLRAVPVLEAPEPEGDFMRGLCVGAAVSMLGFWVPVTLAVVWLLL